jgi:hypothetical protein
MAAIDGDAGIAATNTAIEPHPEIILRTAANPLMCGDAVADRFTIKPLKLQDLMRPSRPW